jgi:hypothetical protein
MESPQAAVIDAREMMDAKAKTVFMDGASEVGNEAS